MSVMYGLPSYDHVTQDWKSFKGRLLQWFIANDIISGSTTENKRRAILLSALSDASYKLASDLALPKRIEDVAFDDILLILEKHFVSKCHGFSERYKFYSAAQQPGETHAQWAARLRGLTADCGFSDVEEALRDRFVMGMTACPERSKLFEQDTATLTMAKAVELAESGRCARTSGGVVAGHVYGAGPVYSMRPGEQSGDDVTSSSGAGQVHSVQRGGLGSGTGKERCSVCGRRNHDSSQCRFRKYKCKKCGTTGHLQKMCKKLNYMGAGEMNGNDNEDDGELFIIRSERGEPMAESVTVEKVQLKFEIDSGSAVTVISERTYEQYFSEKPLIHTNKRLFTYTGDKICCIGKLRLAVTYEASTRELDVYVVRGGGPPLLGRDFISTFNLHLTSGNFVNSVNNCEQDLERQYPEVFTSKLGAFNKYKIKLRLRDDAKPIFIKARPLAFSLRDKIAEELQRLVGLGILKPVQHSRYASPVVPVLKRDGSVRLCVDYSVSINKQLVVEHYPLPTAHELFSRLHGGEQFSKLDLSMAYNQFLLDEESQEITCINTHRGLFQYTRMSFGLSSAPSIFQRAMESVLAGLEGVLCLLDDILITAPNRAEHMRRIHAVLERLRDAGLTLQRSKCEFFKDEISYLGYVINKNGLKKSPEKVKAIVNAPRPDNVSRLQSFLGLVNYYRNFVSGASSLLAPLYELLKKGNKWTWESKHEHVFREIKNRLASDQVLTHFNPTARLILTVDASPSGLGAVLSHANETGTERPISFASRTLNSAEKRYSQIQKEATAIIFGVRRFHQYLYGRSTPFTLRTDHKPLISIFGPYKGIPEVSANRLQRYAMFLSAYNYNIEYVRSADNCADYLSRASLPDVQALAPEPPGPTATQDDVDRASYINFVFDGDIPVTVSRVREHTSNDLLLQKVKDYVLNGWPRKVAAKGLESFHKCRQQLSYENGCMMRGHKVVVPESLKSEVLTELHKSHLGIVKTKAEARARLWFPGIDSAIESMIRVCPVCSQLRPSPPRVPAAPWSYPKKPFERVHIDFLGPINGRTYLVIVDAHSKWLEAYQCNNTGACEVIAKMYEFISRFGSPVTIVSDNGSGFTSHEFQTFCVSHGITHLTSPAYHPASNGQAESFVKIVKKGIKSALLSTSNTVRQNTLLLKYLFDYRNSVHSATGLSPAQIVYGRKLRSRLDLINPAAFSLSSSFSSCVNKKQCLQSDERDSRKIKSFVPGDEIFYKKYLNSVKFVWLRGTILEKIGKVVYLIYDHQTSSQVKKHMNQIVLHSKATFMASELEVATGEEEREQNDNLESSSQKDAANNTSLSSRNSSRLLRDIPRVDYRKYL